MPELHHGVLLYKSNDGLNIFTLAIPKGDISRQETNIDIYNDDFVEQQSKQETILVVEDNLELLSFMTEKLSLNFSVEKATNGAEAFDIIQRVNVDIVVTDIMMPIMDGFELCRKIKTDIEYCHIPVVLLTAKNDLNSKIRGLETGG